MNIKQVIVIRRDLNMRRGKEISQGAHSSGEFFINRILKGETFTEEELWWMQNGIKKVTVQVNTEEEILELHRQAKELGLRSHYIVDEGITEFGGVHTVTALAIGPNESSEIDKVTGNLRLY